MEALLRCLLEEKIMGAVDSQALGYIQREHPNIKGVTFLGVLYKIQTHDGVTYWVMIQEDGSLKYFYPNRRFSDG